MAYINENYLKLAGSYLFREIAHRAEIGPLPPRDRSASASRSVATRTEIGPERRIRPHQGRA